MAGGFEWRNKSDFLTQLRWRSGMHKLPSPYPMETIFDVVIKNSILTFSTSFPRIMKIPVDLNKCRIPHDPDAFTGGDGISDLYEIPPIFPKDSDRIILGIEKVYPYNDQRYHALTADYETIESYQNLALAQGAANLASVIEPSIVVEFIEPNRFRMSTGYYYRDRVILSLRVSYSAEAFDIPSKYRQAFSKLALLDTKMFIYESLKDVEGTETPLAQLNLYVERFNAAEADRDQLLQQWAQKDVTLTSVPCIFF